MIHNHSKAFTVQQRAVNEANNACSSRLVTLTLAVFNTACFITLVPDLGLLVYQVLLHKY
jgi:hypothetical protein